MKTVVAALAIGAFLSYYGYAYVLLAASSTACTNIATVTPTVWSAMSRWALVKQLLRFWFCDKKTPQSQQHTFHFYKYIVLAYFIHCTSLYSCSIHFCKCILLGLWYYITWLYEYNDANLKANCISKLDHSPENCVGLYSLSFSVGVIGFNKL